MKAYIEEFASVGLYGSLPAGTEPSITSQVVTASGASVQSVAFGSATKFVRVNVDGVGSYQFGADPAATVDSPRMSAGQTEYFAVVAGQKVAFIANT